MISSFTGPFVLGSCVNSFGPPFRALVAYHLERSGLPLHDAVGVHCKTGATTEFQGAGAWHLG